MMLEAHGVSAAAIRSKMASQKSMRSVSFQENARRMIKARTEPFSAENRIREKVVRWKFSGPAAHVARRLERNFLKVGEFCRPCVSSSLLRLLWNGVPTSARMRTMEGALSEQRCVLGCEHSRDRIEHYLVCKRIWPTLQKQIPYGLGLDPRHKSLQSMLLAEKGLSDEECMAIAIAGYAISRTIQCVKNHGSPCDADVICRMFLVEGLRGSKARGRLLTRKEKT